MIEDFGGREGDVVFMEDFLQVSYSGFEVEDIAIIPICQPSLCSTSIVTTRPFKTHLLGISLLVIGSYPTHLTPAFSQLAQLGSR
jgi:hypothetical protein